MSGKRSAEKMRAFRASQAHPPELHVPHGVNAGSWVDSGVRRLKASLLILRSSSSITRPSLKSFAKTAIAE